MFLRKLWGKDDFVYEATGPELVTIDKFLGVLDEHVGIESVGHRFMFDYFSFQLNYWVNMDTRFGKKIPLTWFIGKKAISRWFENTEDNQDLFFAHRTAEQLGLRYRPSEPPRRKASELRAYEETEKNRYFNSNKGFVHCLSETSLFNHNSKSCKKCDFQKDCKSVLKSRYYRVYLKRGYA